jgi:anthranilate synthase component I
MKDKYLIHSRHKQLLADTLTPVSIFLKLRDRFPGSVMLECSDYHSREDCYSYICCDPIATFQAKDQQAFTLFPDGTKQHLNLNNASLKEALNDFARAFTLDVSPAKFFSNGLIGFTAYNAVQHFEDIEFKGGRAANEDIPDVRYSLYRYVIAVDHFTNNLHVFEHHCEESTGKPMDFDAFLALLAGQAHGQFKFTLAGDEQSNLTDDEYRELVKKGKHHCQRGDVFQLVLSRKFSQQFKGDEFNVYRALRAVNPSPYLFYFDYGNFKIFGSSPEAQLTVKDGKAGIHPIAGTYRRTGDDQQDYEAAERLKADAKEQAEHVMLVDLARNDLSRHARNVSVASYGEIQFYSHVIHMVSEVTGELEADVSTMDIVADTFPAGTLSGAPKYRAMELINSYEPQLRTFYGGAIGILGIDNNGLSDFNHAIIIRSFVSMNGTLSYQAGAGIVAGSTEDGELTEVFNKIGALRSALRNAESL